MELIRSDHPRGDFRAAIFDFDGTLSLLRRNWQGVMAPMMVETLQAAGTGESPEQLREIVDEFIARLTGRQTIYQMIRLAEEVERRGGAARTPLEYKREYHDRLWVEVGRRVASVREGRAPPETALVPGAAELLAALHAAGIRLYLASGTDEHYVRDELAVLGLDRWFEGRVYGAQDDYQKFSKAMIVDRIIQDAGLQGPQLLGFGDGFVEIEEVRRVGGVAVGVASEENQCREVDLTKRRRLIEAGADLIIPHYQPLLPLLDQLGVARAA
jgi:phosphoglycolate phosphatase-like HAD superfamily hydrolase